MQADPTLPPPLSPGFTTNDDFEQRFQAWGRGTRAEFVTWDYLTNRLRLNESADFSFLPNGVNSQTTRFYVGRMVWRIKGEAIVESPVSLKLERAKLEHNGTTVIDLDVQDLQLGKSDRTLNNAIRGIEPNAMG